MTKKRNDKFSTEFGLWLREQSEIDSSLGFVATNIDYVWENYKTGEWMIIEEKRYMSKLSFSQSKIFEKIKKICRFSDMKFRGFHVIKFEKTNPEDGKIFLNKEEISKEQLISFLRFYN